jgi:hypothetical protein
MLAPVTADGITVELSGVLDELRELARGLHPAALAEGGLRPALTILGRGGAGAAGRNRRPGREVDSDQPGQARGSRARRVKRRAGQSVRRLPRRPRRRHDLLDDVWVHQHPGMARSVDPDEGRVRIGGDGTVGTDDGVQRRAERQPPRSLRRCGGGKATQERGARPQRPHEGPDGKQAGPGRSAERRSQSVHGSRPLPPATSPSETDWPGHAHSQCRTGSPGGP